MNSLLSEEEKEVLEKYEQKKRDIEYHNTHIDYNTKK